MLCFSVLFPTGKFGEFHPRKEKISPSDYIKSRLQQGLSKDSCFRKDAQCVSLFVAEENATTHIRCLQFVNEYQVAVHVFLYVTRY